MGPGAVVAVEQGPAPHRAPGRDLAGQRPREQIDRLGRDGVLIDMGVGPVGHDDIGQRRHPVGHVGVEVEGDRDRHLAPDLGPQRFEQRALAVVGVLGDHGAVERQE
jgi:hypothetical protein